VYTALAESPTRSPVCLRQASAPNETLCLRNSKPSAVAIIHAKHSRGANPRRNVGPSIPAAVIAPAPFFACQRPGLPLCGMVLSTACRVGSPLPVRTLPQNVRDFWLSVVVYRFPYQ
jgi:hypothetical protein